MELVEAMVDLYAQDLEQQFPHISSEQHVCHWLQNRTKQQYHQLSMHW
jgi:hypothetical protein